MFKDVQITLYDIFGYLLPGAIVFISLVILSWAIFWPHETLALISSLPTVEIVGLVFVMYLAGHLIQGLGNVLEPLVKKLKFLDEMPLSSGLEKIVRDSADCHFGKGTGALSSRELFSLCDQALIHHGSAGEREIFVYREGFYRGTYIALTTLCVSLVARMFSCPICLNTFGVSTRLWRPHVAFALVLTSIGAVFAFRRYVRFAEHHRRAGFLRFVALAKAGDWKKAGEGD